MKNISLILNVVLFIAVVFLYLDRFAFSSSTSQTNESTTSSNSDVVFVNMDSLLNGYDMYNDLKTQFMQKQQELEGSLTSKSKAFERKAMEFQQKVDKRLVTSAQAQQMQQTLMNEQQGLVQLKDQLSMELAQDEQNMNRRLYDSIANYVKEYNKKMNHKIIISNSTGGVLLYADKGLNITSGVLNSLNKRYKTSGKIEQTKEETKK